MREKVAITIIYFLLDGGNKLPYFSILCWIQRLRLWTFFLKRKHTGPKLLNVIVGLNIV